MARDKIHEAVKKSLIKDEWIVTDDPLVLLPNEENISIDLGAEKVLLAERGFEKIAVEVKTFDQPSLIYEFHRAIGQYIDYESALIEANEDRVLFMAVSSLIYPRLLNNKVIKRSIERTGMRILVVDVKNETIKSWEP